MPMRRHKTPLSVADKDAREEYKHSSENDLYEGEPETHFEEVEADIAYCDQLQAHDYVGKVEGGIEVGYQKGKCVEYTADERHYPDNAPAHERMTAAGVLAGIGERFRKGHADSRTDGRGSTDEERDVRTVTCKGRGKER